MKFNVNGAVPIGKCTVNNEGANYDILVWEPHRAHNYRIFHPFDLKISEIPRSCELYSGFTMFYLTTCNRLGILIFFCH